MQNLYTEDLQIAYDKRIIVDSLNISIPQGKITALVGANGSGKSTILKTMSRLLKPSKGHVILDGKKIHQVSTKQIAKELAILPQNPTAPGGLTVTELISYGRSPHQSGFKVGNKEDQDMINWALKMTNLEEFKDRPIENLSGGQRQRAWIAMALAQDTSILFLDEPTTFLDMTHQLDVMNILKQLNETENRTIVIVVHDLNHASRYAEHMIAIKNGQVRASGAPKDVMTCEILEDVFNIKADILIDPRSGVPLCLPYETCNGCEIKDVVRELDHIEAISI
ncbi:ABC transporter ATP-binding protein [Listeria fleischmannii]|uniref:ABC transporter ATP-binding protein n=1 Tax=Listeria fleischmannii TaxID=1069827 RepID=A0A841YDD1_9LIST|nr:ABC transporter ATP-binding protein [Listeria fleischmannii]MBC1398240.1 ABC transporter ATP-binding protein [Listeria fleischmannii]MBC1426301.1 ABC transporter ATP-binding protein [Listeria fleischmannii]STY35570.1 Probable siderophore transport system ATP-binding protein YusV [Listeria fleischmannii subsp. coloradonensis]